MLVAAGGDDGGGGGRVERKLKTFLQTDLMFMFVLSSISPAERGTEREWEGGGQSPFLLLVFRGYGLFSLHGRMEITLVDSHKREREGGAPREEEWRKIK